MSGKDLMPWYFRLSRGQWIGIGAGGGLALIFLIIVLAVAGSDDSNPAWHPDHRNPVAVGGNPEQMMAEAERLFQSGKRREALEMLEQAKATALKQGRDSLVVRINQKIHGIRFKTAP